MTAGSLFSSAKFIKNIKIEVDNTSGVQGVKELVGVYFKVWNNNLKFEII